MDIDPVDYTSRTKTLVVGATIKVPHVECTLSNAMRITVDVEGTHYYCFKCNEYYFESSFNSPRERLRRQKAMNASLRLKAAVSKDLPADFSQIESESSLVWLGTGGWTLEMISKYNVGESKELNRVILPVMYRGKYRGYIARSVESWLKPKYLEKVESDVMWESIDIESDNSNTCVLTEDILSAGACGEFVKAYSLLGTDITTACLSELTKYRKVLLWLDPDKAGRKGVQKMYGRIRLVCNDVQVITSICDPKNLAINQLKEALNVE